MPIAPETGPPLRSTLLELAIAWVMATMAWAAWLAVAFQQLNPLRLSDLPVLLGYWWAAYLIITVPAAAVAVSVVLLLPSGTRRRALWIGIAAVGSYIAALVLVSYWGAVSQVVTGLGIRITPMTVIDVVFLSAMWGWAIWGVERLTSGHRRLGVVHLVAVVVITGAGHLANLRYQLPTEVDLAAAVDPYRVPDEACSPTPGTAQGMTLMAVDGMTWNVVAPLLEQGRMPNLARLLGRSAYGQLEIPFPSYSPVVWATIATGLPEDEHGIHGFMRTWLPGLSGPILVGPRSNAHGWVGATDTILSIATDLGLARAEPQLSTQRSAHAIWDIASARGQRVGVYDYMNRWPVAAVAGYMYTQVGQGPASVSPEALLELLEDQQNDDDVPFDDARLIAYEQLYREALLLADAFKPSVAIHFNSVMDTFNDQWWPTDTWFYTPESPPYSSFPPIVEHAYELTDLWLGRFMDSVPRERVFAVISDHGYEFNGTMHAHSPPGVIILSGGPFACGRRIEGAHIYDVLPTLLAALNLPGLDAMPGSVLRDAFAAEPPGLVRRAKCPESWRVPALSIEEGGEDENWDELRQKIRALGYAQ